MKSIVEFVMEVMLVILPMFAFAIIAAVAWDMLRYYRQEREAKEDARLLEARGRGPLGCPAPDETHFRRAQAVLIGRSWTEGEANELKFWIDYGTDPRKRNDDQVQS